MVKRVLITGGAGFVGSHVVDRCMREGCDVTVLDNLYTGSPRNFQHHVGHPRFRFIQHDIQQPLPDEVIAKKFDLIFHLACAASPVHYQNKPIDTTLTCVVGTHNLLREALRNDCPILIASTSEVYGDPAVHPQPEDYVGAVSCNGVRACYDEGKRCAEALCFDFHRVHGVKIRVARIFNTYGPRMMFNDGRIISNFLVQALRGDNITVYGTGEYTRSFQFCDDLVEGFWQLIHHPTETGPCNLGNPEEYSVLEMAQKAKALVPGTKSEIVFLEAAKDDPKQRRPDITKAKATLGWEPKINLQTGLQRTLTEFASRLAAETQSMKKVYIQCNPLLDISSHVDAAFLAKYKLQPASAALCEGDQIAIYAEMEKNADVKYIPGGSALNTARVAQWLSQAPKNSFVSYVGCVADDKYGKILKERSEEEGVNMRLQFSTKNPTGTCAVCIVDKERSMLANLAAANDLTPDHLETEGVKAALEAAEIFYLSGFQLTVSVEGIMKVASRSAAAKGTFIMNLSAPFLMMFFKDQLLSVLPHVDVIISNDEEAREFAKAMGWETTDTVEIAKLAAELPRAEGCTRDRMVIFTQGSNPTVFVTKGGATLQVPVVPIDGAKIIDTNGAGDAFVGGLLAGLSKGCSVEDSIKAGNYSAGVIIQHDGCTYPEKPDYTL